MKNLVLSKHQVTSPVVSVYYFSCGFRSSVYLVLPRCIPLDAVIILYKFNL